MESQLGTLAGLAGRSQVPLFCNEQVGEGKATQLARTGQRKHTGHWAPIESDGIEHDFRSHGHRSNSSLVEAGLSSRPRWAQTMNAAAEPLWKSRAGRFPVNSEHLPPAPALGGPEGAPRWCDFSFAITEQKPVRQDPMSLLLPMASCLLSLSVGVSSPQTLCSPTRPESSWLLPCRTL